MSDVIRLLPDSVANQIAAGEVIQRPASVIKELVENAVDAGATDIRIYIKDAGRTLIQVVDNGMGMTETDARMAFERHATSKIRKADDLFTLMTMGFRGEALPSICAISRVELKSKTEDSPIGTCLIINGSKVESQTPVMCDKGTSISVKNIFFNVPARRKFLKSDNVELANIMREFERLALVNNKIRMSIDTGSRTLQLQAGSFKQRISELWKNNLSMSLLPVEIDTAIIRVSGFISRPEFARRRNALQFLIVNGRNFRHPYFHKAIVSCYDMLIAADTQPCYFLRFEVNPASIDVNISPTKNEIKFENEPEIRPLLVAAIRASLGKNAAVPQIDFESAPIEVHPLNQGEQADEYTATLNPDYNPFQTSRPGAIPPPESFSARGTANAGNYGAKPQTRNWESLYENFLGAKKEEAKAETSRDSQAGLPEMENTAASSMCLQYALKYIVTTTREGVLIIDQHRAHLKILYEEFLAKATEGALVSQRILFPEPISLDNTMLEALREVQPELRRLGFMLEPRSDNENEWLITSVPPATSGRSAREMIIRILDSVCEDSSAYGKDDKASREMIGRMALIMARSSAIERGRRLTDEEMERLVSDLFRLPDPSLTPNGNRIYHTLNESRIEALLK
ncbi:MAG: DNA mismatch repair endonuclease MutL [Muribaculum sp.]|nr:DNA mismatch repair endonuclease MutL [Muribaculum sp.]